MPITARFHFFRRLPLLACLAAFAFPRAGKADNPIVQTIYTADPAPMVHEGRVYVYAGRDEDVLVNNFFTMNEWRVYSSADMVNWTDHGVPLKYNDFTWARSNAWAAQTIFRNGKFYYYVTTAQGIGVAVATSPAGPFKDAIGKALIANSGCGDIDPTVFIDDDGQAYLYWGNPSCCYVKLNADMVSYSGGVVKVPMTTASFGVRTKTDRATSYEEAPWLYKRGSTYYLIFAGGPISEHIAYATSTSPTGPWTYRGIIMTPQGSSFTNHPGIVDFNGGSYFVYHNGALPGGGGYHRSVAIEKFTYNADGTIPSLKMTTAGAPSIAPLNPFQTVEAETIAWETGVETEPLPEGGMQVTSINNGDYIKVVGVDFSTGADTFEARVAAANAGGSIDLYADSATGTLIGKCPVPATGGAQTWKTITCSVGPVTGKHDLFLKFTGGTGDLFRFDWWKFGGAGAGQVRDAGASDASPLDAARDAGGAGGSAATGGTTATGGITATGTGGVARTGGRIATGGIVANGGAASGGAAATGGTVATGGVVADRTGGTASSGGATSAGGVGQTGGTIAANTGGNARTGGANSANPANTTGSGCSCRLGAATSPTGAIVVPVAALFLGLLRRRRRTL